MARRRQPVRGGYNTMCRVLVGLVVFSLMTFTMTHHFMSSGDGQLQLSNTRDRLASFRSRVVGTAANMWHSGGYGFDMDDEEQSGGGSGEGSREGGDGDGGGGGGSDDRVVRLQQLAAMAAPPSSLARHDEETSAATVNRRTTAPPPDATHEAKDQDVVTRANDQGVTTSELNVQPSTESESELSKTTEVPKSDEPSGRLEKSEEVASSDKMNVLFLCADDFRAQTMVRRQVEFTHNPITKI